MVRKNELGRRSRLRTEANFGKPEDAAIFHLCKTVHGSRKNWAANTREMHANRGEGCEKIDCNRKKSRPKAYSTRMQEHLRVLWSLLRIFAAPSARRLEKARLSSNEALLDYRRPPRVHVGLSVFRLTRPGKVFEGLGGYVPALKGEKRRNLGLSTTPPPIVPTDSTACGCVSAPEARMLALLQARRSSLVRR
jgi:hypothetical protein